MNQFRDFIRIAKLVIVFIGALQIASAQTIQLDITEQQISCAGEEDGRAIVVAEGGQTPYTYAWSNGSEDQVINDLSPGTYEVTVTDANGNTATDAAGLIDILPFSISLEKTDGICGEKGVVSATTHGGLGPFQYRWSNGEFGREINGLDEGTYSITITDRNNCPQIDSIEVIVNGEGLKLDSDLGLPSCPGDSDGYISVSQTGGEFPIEYSWNDGTTGTSKENLPAGTYFVFAVDALGCTDGLVFILPDRDALNLEIVNQNTSLFALVEGGTPDYTYSWSNGESGTSVINNLQPGEYGLTVEDAVGCTTTGFAEILSPLNTNVVDEILNFEIYPTIVDQEFDMSLSLQAAESISVQIFNAIGKEVLNQTFYGNDHQSKIVAATNWEAGIYYLVVRGESGWVSTKNFIKR